MTDQDYSFFGFSCTWCKYKCARKNDMQKHMLTSKHKKNVERVEQLGIMKINHTSKSSMFSEDSAVKPVNSVVMKTGLQSNTGSVAETKQPAPFMFTKSSSINSCVCGKVYKHLSSLCKHRKKCDEYILSQNDNQEDKEDVTLEISEQDTPKSNNRYGVVVNTSDTDNNQESLLVDISNELLKIKNSENGSASDMMTNTLAEIIKEQTKQNVELKTMLEQQSIEILKLNEKTSTNNVTNITTNNTVNNKFNLNVFLKTECKNAMNIMDFIDSLPVNVSDLENMGHFGFVEGITRILLNGLRNLDIEKRPIHCSDVKRESIYIKDNDTWEKDNVQNDKMKKVIRYVRHKNVKQIPEWQRNNPSYSNYTSKTHAKYMNIIGNTMGGSSEHEDEQLQNKIIKKVIPDVTIPKSHRLKLSYTRTDNDDDDD